MNTIIFDFDDTLEDFAAARLKAHATIGAYLHKKHDILPDYFNKVFSAMDLDISHKAASKDPAYYKREIWFQEFFTLVSMSVSKKELRLLTRMYWQAITAKAKLLPHVKTTLRQLAKSHNIVIMSDSDGNKLRKYERIKRLSIFPLIDLIVLGDDVGVNKPHKRFYSHIFKKLKVRPKDCIMVGDKPEVDLKLAKQLGMKTVWMQHGAWTKNLDDRTFYYVDHKIKDIRLLKKIL